MRWPSLSDVLSELVDIRAEAKTYKKGELDGDAIEVRLQVYEDGDWSIHTGDPSYDQDHRGYWGASYVGRSDSMSTLKTTARDLIEEAKDHEAMS